MRNGPPRIELTGRVVGRLTVIGPAPRVEKRPLRWVARCECGVVKEYCGQNLRRAITRSCGCLKSDVTGARNIANTKHGQSKRNTSAPSREYNSWSQMICRCENPKHQAYDRYGGRGIAVCDRWRKSFEDFFADMGARPPKTSLDRIDTNKGYDLSNCKWSTHTEQQRNKRDNVMITIDGETLCQSAWAERSGIGPTVIAGRIKRGWTPRDAVFAPPGAAHYGLLAVLPNPIGRPRGPNYRVRNRTKSAA